MLEWLIVAVSAAPTSRNAAAGSAGGSVGLQDTGPRPLRIRAARAAARALMSTAFPRARVILGGSNQLLVVVHQLVRRHKALDPQPGFPRGSAHQGYRSVAHLLAAVDIESPLRRKARGERAGVVLRLRTRMKPVRVRGEACRRVLLRIDRDRHQMHTSAFRTEPALEFRERLTHERADGRTAGEDEIQHDGPTIIHFPRERHTLPV